jgi:cGMP-dependent protein kinase
MDKKIPPRIKIIAEDSKKSKNERKVVKHKEPIRDPRRASRIAADAMSAVVTDRLKTPKDLEMISNALNKHFIFTSLSAENRTVVILQMKHYSMMGKEPVFDQGVPGSLFFVVCSGKLEVSVNNKRVNVLGPGDSFGELALLHDSPRSASVRTLEKVTMWGLDRKSFRTAVETVNAENYKENQVFIDSVPLFNVLTNMQKDSLVGSLSTLKFRPGDPIVNQGDPGDLFYILKEGIVHCLKDGEKIREMGKGEFFGEQALLYNTVRTASVVAHSNVKCVAISRNKLNIALGNNLENIIYENTKVIAFERSENLKLIDKRHQVKIMKKMKVVKYPDNSKVAHAGTLRSAKMFIVLFGDLKYKNQGFSVYSTVGDLEIMQNNENLFEYDLITCGETHLAEISRQAFVECTDNSIKTLSLDKEAIAALKEVHILRSIPPEKFKLLIQCLKVQQFEDKDVIIRQNTPGDSFFLIKSGKVDIVQSGVLVRTVAKHDYFGERSLIFDDYRSASVIAHGPVVCWFLTRSDFQSILEESLHRLLLKRIELQDNSITLLDLVPVKLLGQGNFGLVFLVINSSNKRLYALKAIPRRKIDRYGMQENLILERKILLTLDHVMILKMVKSFKDSKRIYFLTEYVRGCDMFDALREMNTLSDREGKFYIGCLLLVLEYLHERDIVYRDLKPENVMIEEDGYPKLIDFGISKILSGRTYTVVGTPHYMAPEVILGKGYTYSVDLWSLGIMLYELFCFNVPFGENEEDPYMIYEKVLQRKLVYPSFVDSKLPAKGLIEVLLNKNPSLRNLGSPEALKNHQWFQGLNWESLINKQVTAGFKPSLPDIGNDLQKATKIKESLDEFIDKYDADDLNETASRRSRNVPLNWDSEF